MTWASLVRENRNLLLRMLLLPVGLLVVLGFVFSKIYVENIPFGVVDLDQSSLSRLVVRQFKLHPGFRVDRSYDSERSLEAAIRNKEVLGGVVLPPAFHRDLAAHRSPTVLLLLDGTNVIVATLAQGYGSTILGTMNAGFQVALLEGRGLLPAQTKASVTSFTFVSRVLYEPTLSYLMYLVYLIFLYTTQTLYFAQFLMPHLMKKKHQWLASDHPEGGWRREVVRSLALPGLVILTLGLSTYLGLMVGFWLFGIQVLGTLVPHLVLVAVFLTGLTGLGLFFASVIQNLRSFLEAYYILALVLLLTSGVAWPAAMMPPGFDVVVQLFWPLFNVAYPLKALHLKDLGWDLLWPVVGKGLLFAAVWGGLGSWLLRRALPQRPH